MEEKGKRAHISAEQREVLMSSFSGGMTSTSSPLVITAAEATGLEPAIVKNWIGNHKRDLNPSTSKPTKKAKMRTRALTGYNLFCAQQLHGNGNNDSLRNINTKWSSLNDEQKAAYRAEAAAVEAADKMKPLTQEQRAWKKRRHLRQFQIDVDSLEELGVEASAMAYDRKQADTKPVVVYEYCSKGAEEYLSKTKASEKFACHFQANSSGVSSTKDRPGEIVKRVQDLFNQKYREAGGQGNMPYQSLKDQKVLIRVTGMPDGLVLKKPSRFGRNQLQKILQAAEQLSFEIMEHLEVPVPLLEDSTSMAVATTVEDSAVEQVDPSTSEVVLNLKTVAGPTSNTEGQSAMEILEAIVDGPTSNTEGQSAMEILEAIVDDGNCSTAYMDTSTVVVQPAVKRRQPFSEKEPKQRPSKKETRQHPSKKERKQGPSKKEELMQGPLKKEPKQGPSKKEPGYLLCIICHGHYEDEKLNSDERYVPWRECTKCKLWGHLACGFKKNLCKRCQPDN